MRPEILFPLFKQVSALPKVGPETQKLLQRLNIYTVRDLVMTAPVRGIDRTLRTHLEGVPSGTNLSVRVVVVEHVKARSNKAPSYVIVKGLDTLIRLVFFRAAPRWLQSALPIGATRIISGTLEMYDFQHQMTHPDYMLTEDAFRQIPVFEPVYSVTAGLTNKFYRKILAHALRLVPTLPEWNDMPLMQQKGWSGWKESILALHQPDSEDDFLPSSPVRERLAFDELFSHQMLLMNARSVMRREPKRPLQPTGYLQNQLLANLPYQLTHAQNRVTTEIISDMCKPLRMLRLLQGDVGAGKTLVALIAMLATVENDGQCALMVPTEVLARQHGKSIESMCENLVKENGAPVVCIVLTGRDKGKLRTQINSDISIGKADIIIGTHALFQTTVTFKNLKLVVLDEQHRFGVNQRLTLVEKGENVDILTMTATPIPRTLCLAQYGDMDISVLDEKPAGRQPIETRVLSTEKIPLIVQHLQTALESGAQVYWICPLVEESEKLDLTAAQDRFDFLSEYFAGKFTVGLVHGKQPPKDKEDVLDQFAKGNIQLLVATTVIEVGIDVPQASIIIIEHAERFGLAQLHQLRGRVGRGKITSSCLLLYSKSAGKSAQKRLGIMRTTTDGFKIAEEDFTLRGSGDIIGVQQSGLPIFYIAQWHAHRNLIELASTYAKFCLTKSDSEQDKKLTLLASLFEKTVQNNTMLSG